MILLRSRNYLIFVIVGLLSATSCEAVTGEEAYSQTPWYITLYISCPTSGSFKTCGGSLISQEWILTTASCVSCNSDDANRMIVADVGMVNKEYSSTVGMGRYIVDKVVTHNKHKGSRNNIALLHLQHTVLDNPGHTVLQINRCYQVNNVGGRNTAAVELISRNMTNTDERRNSVSSRMKMIRQSKCVDLSASCLKSEVSTAAASSDFCAVFVHNENLTCHYNEGMPLGMQSDNQWMAVGFVADKPEDCSACPTLFTRVCSYYEWIENIISATEVLQGNVLFKH